MGVDEVLRPILRRGSERSTASAGSHVARPWHPDQQTHQSMHGRKVPVVRVCSQHGCPTIYPTSEGSRCSEHRKQADKARGTAAHRGYNSRGHKDFRAAVLNASPLCSLCGREFALVADHYPLGRDELIARGMNPNDPAYGRGLCRKCDSTQTADRQPGGWNRR